MFGYAWQLGFMDVNYRANDDGETQQFRRNANLMGKYSHLKLQMSLWQWRVFLAAPN